MTVKKSVSVLVILILLLILLSGCVDINQVDSVGDSTEDRADNIGEVDDNHAKETPVKTSSATPVATKTPVKQDVELLLIDNISLDLTSYNEEGWSNLYQLDELDCSRMSTYFWKYVRDEYNVAPKIIVSYERQHAWLALKVSDVGNSSKFKKWTYKNVDYYYLEATVPKIVTDDGGVFVINNVKYTSAEFYNATIYYFDSPQEANDFHADNTYWGSWNQEFRMKKDDLDSIAGFIDS